MNPCLFSDVTGFRTNCTCLSACEVRVFGPELSYAALSSLSVDSIIAAAEKREQKNYQKALEAQQRVRPSAHSPSPRLDLRRSSLLGLLVGLAAPPAGLALTGLPARRAL